MTQFTVPCVIYRGGTSRGLFFHQKDLPSDQRLCERIFLKGIGSEDASHINGLGAGTSHTSKVVIIDKSDRPEIDVDYTFVQLGIGDSTIDYEGTCGNLMAAVGAFAVDEGLVDMKNTDSVKNISVWSTNIGKRVNIQVPVKNGYADVVGDFHLAGIKDPGAKYLVDIVNPGGGKTGKTLPLGAESQVRFTSEKAISYSFVDVVNPFVYVKASDLNITGTESNHTIAEDGNILFTLDEIRANAAAEAGLAPDVEAAKNISKAIPKISYVAPPQDYMTSNGTLIKKEEYDILARMVSMNKMHRTFAVSGLLNVAAACLLTGSIPNQVCQLSSNHCQQIIRVGHPEGVISVRVGKYAFENEISYVGLERTARRIMSGNLYIPR